MVKSELPNNFKPNYRKILFQITELAKQIDTTRMKAPAFKMILTATGEHAYRRPEDGIYIVPIGCLKQ